MPEIFEIIPGLFQGSHLRQLPDFIEAVLNVDWTDAHYKTDTLKGYTHMPILDGPDPGEEWLKNVLKTLTEYRANKWNIYIHCQAGMSRSVFATAALLIREQHMAPQAAIALINSKSGYADPAPAFILALREMYENEVAKAA